MNLLLILEISLFIEYGPKGNNGFKHNYIDNISMSFIIGFSISRIYGMLGKTAKHDHRSFISFISNIIDYRTSVLNLTESKFIII